MNDRVLYVSFAISLAAHLTLLVGQMLSFPWWRPPTPRHPLQVIYEYEAAQQELRRLQAQLARAKRETVAVPSSFSSGERPQIRIPTRPLLSTERLLEAMPDRSSLIDLTNLVEASRGDPVLLTYFGAIREQIQRTANQQTWLTGAMNQGLVYVSFTLLSTGALQDAAIVGDRSAAIEALRGTALHIVTTAAPFPPFPPSLGEPSKVIVVPLEFLLGS